MKLLFDHQTFVEQPYGGISRYIVELIKGLNADSTNEAYLSLLYAENDYLPTKHEMLTSLLGRNFPKKKQILTELNKLYSKTQLLRRSFDVFHATYYDPYFLPYVNNKPVVVTFHDMIHERYSNQYALLGNDRRITPNKKLVANRATKLIAVSESTKRDIIEFFNVDPNKIHVIYHGCTFTPRPKHNKITGQPYLLHVGHRHAYKNFEPFLQSIAPLLNKYDCRLVCAGGGEFTNSEKKLINSLNLERHLVWYSIDNDEKLRQLYENAIAFVFPSLYEGFGMPVIEAFACGCPCVISNTSSLPEVGGDAVLFMDPNNTDSMYEAVNTILNNPSIRNMLIQRGYERSKLFSWDNTVKQTVDLYRICGI